MQRSEERKGKSPGPGPLHGQVTEDPGLIHAPTVNLSLTDSPGAVPMERKSKYSSPLPSRCPGQVRLLEPGTNHAEDVPGTRLGL